jgi:hypothetical protein
VQRVPQGTWSANDSDAWVILEDNVAMRNKIESDGDS